MAWGTPAGKRVQKIDAKRHLVLKAVHPSPLSASRGFFDCGHFKKANEWLAAKYGEEGEIDWSLGPHSTSATNAGLAAAAAKKANLDEDVDEEWEAEAAAAITEAENKANVMGPPPTPSPKKGDKGYVSTPETKVTGKENGKPDIPA